MRRSGLALGGSLENAVVIGETGVLNNKLRFEDEFVRHKILDAIGDLALLGCPLVGRLEARKAGHALHAAVARKLLATEDAWALVSSPGIPALGDPQQALPGLTTRTAPAPPVLRAAATFLRSPRPPSPRP
jgi:UDP-3-O-acyl-N-acetylglucosamine deacetylase